MMRLITGLSLLCLAVAGVAAAPPAVFWASDPLRPGETLLLMGSDFGNATVEVARLTDAPPTDPLSHTTSAVTWQPAVVFQPTPTALKCVMPDTFAPGVFAYRITTPAGSASGLVNRPKVWWLQGNTGEGASPGGWVRLFGANLGWEPPANRTTTVLLTGPKTVRLSATADTYSASITLPDDLPPGTYEVALHNGCGGDAAWSLPVALTIATPVAWPTTRFNVTTFGANGQDSADDTAAVQAAIAKAGKNGGGVVYFPRGRYQLKAMLEVPRHTVLQGEAEELVSLMWPDGEHFPTALIHGTNAFGVENLTIYATTYLHGIYADERMPDAGDVFLRKVRIRADRFRGHLNPDIVNARVQALQNRESDTVHLGGRNVEISDCDIYGSSRALYLWGAHGGRVTNNTFYNGRGGWYCITGSDGLIFERNRIIGADLMSTGGSLNCYDTPSSENVYYAGNQLSLMHGHDREAMTSDAGGGLYLGPVVSASGTRLVLSQAPEITRNWIGAAVFIHAGRGEGQYRRITAIAGPVVTLDAPWAVPPDKTSTIGITMLQRHYLLLNNAFSDAGIAIQFYGTSIEHIVAGNRCERAGGFQAIGKPYGATDLPKEAQPTWYCQFLDNTITEGNVYRGGANNAISSAQSVIAVYGWPQNPTWSWPFARGAVVRRNDLQNNAEIHLGGCANASPSVRDVVVEHNRISNADTGIVLDKATAGILLRGNVFDAVTKPLSGAGAPAAVLTPEQLEAMPR